MGKLGIEVAAASPADPVPRETAAAYESSLNAKAIHLGKSGIEVAAASSADLVQETAAASNVMSHCWHSVIERDVTLLALRDRSYIRMCL